MRKLFALTTLLLLLVPSVAYAQATAQQTPPTQDAKVSQYIWVLQEKMNAGKWQAYEGVIRQYREAAVENKADFYWLAGMPVTGSGNEVTLVSFHPNWASIDNMMATMDKLGETVMRKNARVADEVAESTGDSESYIAKYLPEYSYNPMKVDAAHAKRWMVTMIQYRPGSNDEMMQLLKERIEAYRKAGLDMNWLTYQVMAGVPGPAILIVRPLVGLNELDTDYTEKAKAALGAEWMKTFSDFARANVMKVETQVYSVSPRMSRPAPDMVAANPSFWTVKDEGGPQVARKAGKKGPVEPAAKRETTKK